MDQDLGDRLTRLEKMVSDNNRMLVRLRRAQRNAAFVRVLYWLVAIVLAIAAWYYVQPYITSLTNEYSTITGKGGSTDNSNIMNLINQYTGQKTGK